MSAISNFFQTPRKRPRNSFLGKPSGSDPSCARAGRDQSKGSDKGWARHSVVRGPMSSTRTAQKHVAHVGGPKTLIRSRTKSVPHSYRAVLRLQRRLGLPPRSIRICQGAFHVVDTVTVFTKRIPCSSCLSISRVFLRVCVCVCVCVHQFNPSCPVRPVHGPVHRLGQYLCVYCDQYFISEAVMQLHFKQKVHKKRVKAVNDKPYSQRDAEAAVGMAPPL